MNTLLTCQCDSIVAKVNNDKDVCIVAIICVTLLLFALIAKCAVMVWRVSEIRRLTEERQDKAQREIREADRKLLHNLIEKRIDALKEQAVEKDKEGKTTFKSSDDKYFQAYENALNKYIEVLNANLHGTEKH